jgi:hypothetical protein
MPTAAKLAAAILFGALAWLVSELVRPLFPEGTNLGRFALYNAMIGAVVGWGMAGARARTTWSNAVAYGLTAAASMVMSGLIIYGILKMVRQSTRRVYEGPVEAMVDVVRIIVEDAGKYLAQPEILLTLAVGGVVCGLITEWVGRNYP